MLGEETRKSNKPLLQLLNGQDFTIVELLEVRLVLESNSAVLAARRATEEDVRIIEQSLNRLLEARDLERNLDNELSFHMNIAYATKNIVQVHLMKSFYDVLYYGMNLAFPTLIKDEKLDNPYSNKRHPETGYYRYWQSTQQFWHASKYHGQRGWGIHKRPLS